MGGEMKKKAVFSLGSFIYTLLYYVLPEAIMANIASQVKNAHRICVDIFRLSVAEDGGGLAPGKDDNTVSACAPRTWKIDRKDVCVST